MLSSIGFCFLVTVALGVGAVTLLAKAAMKNPAAASALGRAAAARAVRVLGKAVE